MSLNSSWRLNEIQNGTFRSKSRATQFRLLLKKQTSVCTFDISVTYSEVAISIMDNNQPDVPLYFLEASHAIRIAWLLEELALPYILRTLANSGLITNAFPCPSFLHVCPPDLLSGIHMLFDPSPVASLHDVKLS